MDRWSQLSMSEKSDLMSLYIKNGISSLEEIKKHYNSFADGGHLYQDGGPNEPNFVGGATALKKNYDYTLEHLAEKYPVTAEGPWHDYGIHNPSESQKAHWNKLTRMYNRVAQRPDYEFLNPTKILEYTPVVGDAIDAAYNVDDISKGNVGIGLAGLGLSIVPNAIEKPLKTLGRTIKTAHKRYKNFKNYDKDALFDNVREGFVQQEQKYSNLFETSPSSLTYPKVSTNPISWIWSGRMHQSLIPKNWDLRKDVYGAHKGNKIWLNPKIFTTHNNKLIEGRLAHEFTHDFQKTYNNKGSLSIENDDYFVANPNNPAYNHGLSDFNKATDVWHRSPNEFQADVNTLKYMLDVPFNKPFYLLDPSLQEQFINIMTGDFRLPENIIGKNLNMLSRGLYFNNGGML